MYRKKFGKLIVALRREHTDNQLKPWTRQKFAEESGIDEEMLTNIENGRKAILYPDLLVKIANSLNLTSGERKGFFLAASGVEEHNIYHQTDSPKTVLEDMLAIMDKMQQPAILIDQFFDIVAINLMAMEVYNVQATHFSGPNVDPVTSVNLIRFLFSDEFNEQKLMFGKLWETFAVNTIMLFRAASLRYRATEYFQRLYSHLHEFDEFKGHVQRKYRLKDEHYMDNNMFITLDNPRFGLIRCISTSVTVGSDAGELKLITLTPLSEATVKVFTSMAQQVNYVFQPLLNWPDKSILAEK